jgi:hypothetical protein
VEPVECIFSDGEPLAYVIRAEFAPTETTFVTPDDLGQQVGFIVYPKDEGIRRHSHQPRERRVSNTGEVLVVREGRCEVDLYDVADRLVATRELRAGDVIVLTSGGHGFRMLEDTAFLEIKQGPYLGGADKRYF